MNKNNYQASDLVGDLLSTIDKKWLEASFISTIVDKLELDTVQEKINFLREFKELFRLIPETVFESSMQRDNIFECIQICQDKLIEEEEQLFDGMG